MAKFINEHYIKRSTSYEAIVKMYFEVSFRHTLACCNILTRADKVAGWPYKHVFVYTTSTYAGVTPFYSSPMKKTQITQYLDVLYRQVVNEHHFSFGVARSHGE